MTIDRLEFEGYVRRHEADENAHAAERHQQNNEWIGQRVASELRILELEKRMNQHDVVHAGSSGELRGIRYALAVIALLITAFGGTALYIAVYH